MKKNVFIFLADGFEETEALAVVDVLRRGEVPVQLVSISDTKEVKGAHQILVIADRLIKDISEEDIDAIILPGGLPGATNLEACDQLNKLILKAHERKALLAAICAAPVVYGHLGLLKDRKVTCYPSFEEKFDYGDYLSEGVVKDAHFITGRGPAYAFPFGLAILEYLCSSEKAKEVADGLLMGNK